MIRPLNFSFSELARADKNVRRILILSRPMKNNIQEKNSDVDFSSVADLQDFVDSIFDEDWNLPPEGEKYVGFYLDEKLYAVHSRQVIEVAGQLAVTPLPFVPDWLAGIANLRGDILSVVDLRTLWKKTSNSAASVPNARSKFLILRSEKDNRIAAFKVDKLSELITLAPCEVEFSAADFESSFPTFFGRYLHKSQTVFLLDSENLFSSLSTA